MRESHEVDCPNAPYCFDGWRMGKGCYPDEVLAAEGKRAVVVGRRGAVQEVGWMDDHRCISPTNYHHRYQVSGHYQRAP